MVRFLDFFFGRASKNQLQKNSFDIRSDKNYYAATFRDCKQPNNFCPPFMGFMGSGKGEAGLGLQLSASCRIPFSKSVKAETEAQKSPGLPCKNKCAYFPRRLRPLCLMPFCCKRAEQGERESSEMGGILWTCTQEIPGNKVPGTHWGRGRRRCVC